MPSSKQALLSVDDLRVSYDIGHESPWSIFSKPAQKQVVKGVSFQLNRAEVLGIVGPSGCGKTSTCRAIAGLTPKSSGSIHLNGKSISGTQSNIQVIFQDPIQSFNPKLTIYDNLCEPMRYGAKKQKKNEQKNRIFRWVEKVGLNQEQLWKYPHEFSGGQLQRLGIARALISEPTLVICDEPVSALDISIQAQILNLLRELQRELKLSLLFITHDLAVVRYISQRCIVMEEGIIVEEGATEDLIKHPKHPQTQNLISNIPDIHV